MKEERFMEERLTEKERTYYRAYAEVDLEAVRRNVRTAKAALAKETGLIAVIKTDAYGHGACRVAHAIEDMAAGYAVATVEEALELRMDGIKKPVLILGYVSWKEYAPLIEHGIIATVYSYEQAEKLSDAAAEMGRTALCHIKVDTGMNRIGIPAKNSQDIESAVGMIERIKTLPMLCCDGIFTHFATADEADKTKAKEQYERFCLLLEALKKKEISFTYRHCSNSAAIMDMPEAAFEWVRQGITLYGLKPSDEVRQDIPLYPAMALKSHIVHIKTIFPGDEVSYGGDYVAQEERRIATVSIGYGDGYPRQLSGKACVLVRGRRAPIVGRICMDQFMIDVTDIPETGLEDTVTLFGRDGNEVISVEELGRLCGRFNYEFVCGINKRVKRLYIP